MSADVDADFARLHATTQVGVGGFDATKKHPLFSAVHSFALAHRYGKEDPATYMKNPGLRTMDTREAAIRGMQSAGDRVRRYADLYRPSIPGPVGTVPEPTTPAPEMPSAYGFIKRNYSARMSPPGMVS
jgi:hypothetical protein